MVSHALGKVEEWAVPAENQTGEWRGLRIYFLDPPGNFRFFTLPLEIPDKAKFHPCKLHKIFLHSLKILRSKIKTPENSTWFFS